MMVVALAVAACQADGTASTGDPPRIECAVTGVAPDGASVAVYVDVFSARDDRIVSASSPGAARATLHELEVLDGGGVMRPVDRIAVDAGWTRLGGVTNHVMLEGLSDPLEAGDTVALELTFERHGPVRFEATVLTNDDLRLALDRPCAPSQGSEE